MLELNRPNRNDWATKPAMLLPSDDCGRSLFGNMYGGRERSFKCQIISQPGGPDLGVFAATASDTRNEMTGHSRALTSHTAARDKTTAGQRILAQCNHKISLLRSGCKE